MDHSSGSETVSKQTVRRPRFRLITAMIFVALVAVILGGYLAARKILEQAESRRQAVAYLTADYNRAADRVRWTTRMHKKGFVSEATLVGDRSRLEKLRLELTRLGAPPK